MFSLFNFVAVVALRSRGLVWDALCRVLGGGPWARL